MEGIWLGMPVSLEVQLPCLFSSFSIVCGALVRGAHQLSLAVIAVWFATEMRCWALRLNPHLMFQLSVDSLRIIRSRNIVISNELWNCTVLPIFRSVICHWTVRARKLLVRSIEGSSCNFETSTCRSAWLLDLIAFLIVEFCFRNCKFWNFNVPDVSYIFLSRFAQGISEIWLLLLNLSAFILVFEKEQFLFLTL